MIMLSLTAHNKYAMVRIHLKSKLLTPFKDVSPKRDKGR